VNDSAVSANDAPSGGPSGGGIYNQGTLTLRDSSVTDNHTVAHGGGIFNGSTGTTTLRKSTVSANSVAPAGFFPDPPSGGGIYNQGDLTLRSSTVSGNSAPTGPGIFNDGGTVTLKHSTVQP
jgi:hypothetical protein